jgi:uncharacterized protein with PIN domain
MSIKVKKKKDKKFEKEISKKMGLFDKTPDHCLVCETPFDKKNREMVMSWYVVVREEKQKVNLYCPQCWGVAIQTIEEVKNARVDS